MTKQSFHDSNDDAKYSSLLQARKELKAELITYFCLKQADNPNNVVSVEVDLDTTVWHELTGSETNKKYSI